ncbi:unknown [Methanothermobacter thermautotrophicus str. Delta H]|uniref:Uncharacterized protein n=1 Tax=Methanothermobacter thermautotrophicus (strain ATCC 29096 / DSM 1053 / JCM 10044 / NBRC 100330 / Delta H) TaxID=187420 RepID=O26455_METTH|nr:unknown [Methanothermobacter thermautotrophicus str. Delta H]
MDSAGMSHNGGDMTSGRLSALLQGIYGPRMMDIQCSRSAPSGCHKPRPQHWPCKAGRKGVSWYPQPDTIL